MADTELTAKQRAVYDYIKEYLRANSFPPAVRDIARAIGVSSPATVHQHINTLIAKGYLARDAHKSRALTVVSDEENTDDATPEFSLGEVLPIPVIGTVAAGTPILAEENVEETYPLPASLIKGDTFMLRVHGESMIDAGIFDGDLVIVHQQDDAHNGDIVVALLDDSATVKTFYREPDRIRLQPQNETMAPIYARDVRIAGKVVGLLRMGM